MIFVDVLSNWNIMNWDMPQWTVILLADRVACDMNKLLKICVFISSCDEQTLKCMQADWIISTFRNNWLFVVDLPGYLHYHCISAVHASCFLYTVRRDITCIQDEWLSITDFLYFNIVNNHENVMSWVLKFSSQYFDVCTMLHVQFIIQTNNCTTYVF